MHSKVIAAILVFLAPALVVAANFDTDKFVKDIGSKSDARAVDIIKNGISNGNAVTNNTVNSIVKNASDNNLHIATKKDAPIATGNGVDIGNMIGKYQPAFKQAVDKPRKLNQLLIFISLSMPQESLKELSTQAKKAGGLLVLRGLVNNSFKETTGVLAKASEEGIDAVIDPRLFEAFGITTVPTFVVTPTDSHPCADDKCKFTPIHDKISGNITLEYALEQISKRGEVSNNVAKGYLSKLRGETK